MYAQSAKLLRRIILTKMTEIWTSGCVMRKGAGGCYCGGLNVMVRISENPCLNEFKWRLQVTIAKRKAEIIPVKIL
jgi:hypothetical protein